MAAAVRDAAAASLGPTPRRVGGKRVKDPVTSEPRVWSKRRRQEAMARAVGRANGDGEGSHEDPPPSPWLTRAKVAVEGRVFLPGEEGVT